MPATVRFYGSTVPHRFVSDTPAGSLINLSGDIVAVVLSDAKSGHVSDVGVWGVYEIDKESTVSLTQGQRVYLDVTNQRISTNNTHPSLGVVVGGDYGAGTTKALVLINM
jgi:predicted RecA/RadA family phage recombinase